MSKVKLYQMECPTCGANINVNIQDDKTVCPYCRNTFNIESTEMKLDAIRVERERNMAQAEMERAAIENEYQYRQNQEGKSDFRKSKYYCKAFDPQILLDNAVVFGRKSVEEIYSDLIESDENKISVSCTEGMYNKSSEASPAQ